ncbi:DNA-directed RNA polymerase, subunit L [Pseudoloma neurophilia]|uniref:DNA-directed RNA polymerase, subunit L n=1 Tax=Pseudoloma neurophilia TaxID=146866 RepID=A0A0R0LXE4_9MICR|nr:DNA-directed RNA polymerase, subunit L [Pseudoloma neurophilia]
MSYSYRDPVKDAQSEFTSIEQHPKIKLIDENILQIADEDHTLMNILQHVIVENRKYHKPEQLNDNKFLAGYIIPHPSEKIVQFKVYGDDLFEVIERGLTDIEEMCLIAVENIIALRESSQPSE